MQIECSASDQTGTLNFVLRYRRTGAAATFAPRADTPVVGDSAGPVRERRRFVETGFGWTRFANLPVPYGR